MRRFFHTLVWVVLIDLLVLITGLWVGSRWIRFHFDGAWGFLSFIHVSTWNVDFDHGCVSASHVDSFDRTITGDRHSERKWGEFNIFDHQRFNDFSDSSGNTAFRFHTRGWGAPLWAFDALTLLCAAAFWWFSRRRRLRRRNFKHRVQFILLATLLSLGILHGFLWFISFRCQFAGAEYAPDELKIGRSLTFLEGKLIFVNEGTVGMSRVVFCGPTPLAPGWHGFVLLTEQDSRIHRFQLQAPMWFTQGVLALPVGFLLLALVRQRRAHRRQLAGCCPVCGYDLRATPERCPECGTLVKRE